MRGGLPAGTSRLTPRGRLLLVGTAALMLLIVASRCPGGTSGSSATPGPTPSRARTQRAGPIPTPSPSATAPRGSTPVDPATFAPGSCIAYPPTSGNRHQTVFLDAGHGGPDPGAEGITQGGTSINERETTLPAELDAVPMLQALGYRVVVSRTTDSAVARLGPGDMSGGLLSVQGDHNDTAARAICADRANADVLVSIHFNSAPSASAAGMLTAYDNARPFAAQNLALATLLQHDVLAAINAHGAGVPDDGVVTDDFDGGNALSAAAAAYGHLLILGPAQPGYFDTPSTMPGALIEPLFLTDPFEGSIAASTAGQHAIASGITQALDAFLNPPATPPAP